MELNGLNEGGICEGAQKTYYRNFVVYGGHKKLHMSNTKEHWILIYKHTITTTTTTNDL